jgi:hypothetical protein
MNKEINDLIKALRNNNKRISPDIARLILDLDKKIEGDKIANFRRLLIERDND